MKKNPIYLGIALVAMLATHSACSDDNDINPSATSTYTTVNRTIVPKQVPTGSVVEIDDPANFSLKGFGLWDYGPGIPFDRRTDLMPQTYDVTAVSKSAKLLRFFTMTDVHITDKESPAQAIYFRNEPALRGNAVSVYAPIMLYSTHVLDAAVKTINKLYLIIRWIITMILPQEAYMDLEC